MKARTDAIEFIDRSGIDFHDYRLGVAVSLGAGHDLDNGHLAFSNLSEQLGFYMIGNGL